MVLSWPIAAVAGTAQDHGFHPLRIGRVIPETADASSFVLEVPDELKPAFTYEAGQFCTFRVRVDGQTIMRCYSMSSSPAVDTELRVTVKRTPGGVVSNWMNDQLAAGDIVEVTRPAGVFLLRPNYPGDLVAFSAGSGITPVLSLLKTALTTTSRTVRLFYANRDHEAVIFRSEIEALRTQYGERFSVCHHLDVEQGLVRPDAIRDFTDVTEGSEFYICGPAPFMDVVERALLSGGATTERIHIERFTPAALLSDPEPEPSPSATPPAQVTVQLDGRSGTTDHRPGTTILQAARQMGMSPPFSCESGSCATCMARLVEGTAAMHVNNALTADEVAEGWVLTCQAVPTSPSVHAVYSYEEG
jgi:ferredoxin-NADP reductase